MHCKACDKAIVVTLDSREELCTECFEIAMVAAGLKKLEGTELYKYTVGAFEDEANENLYCEGD